MAIDASIYNLLAQPRKSAFDYANEFEQADASRLAQQQARQLNALQIGAAQDAATERARALAEDKSWRDLMARGVDLSTPAGLQQGMQISPAKTQAWQKQDLEAKQTKSVIAKNQAEADAKDWELNKKKADFALMTGISGRSPSQVREMLTQAVNSKLFTGQEAQSILSDLPSDEQAAANPQVFQQWRLQAMQHGMDAKDRLAAEYKAREDARAAQGKALEAANKPFNVGPNGESIPNMPVQNYELSKTKAGAAKTQVSIDTGQKGFENESKLRDNFKAEPVYKAYQEMDSAHRQIIQALTQANPIGDMAAATKIMKLLDPGSVVRESELGMAMAATGLMDRAINYADNIIKGTKLTPLQRKEFSALADKLYSESASQFDAKRNEYIKLGGEYGLNAERALGPVARTARTSQKPAQAGAPASQPAGVAGLPDISAIDAELARRKGK